MQTRDESLLFQTDAQLAVSQQRALKAAAYATVGSPISVKGKILDFLVAGDDAFVAESGWQARRLDLHTGKTRRLYKGHNGPVTSISMLEISPPGLPTWRVLFTGSWDKTIRVWNADTGEVITVLQGHTDFVKSLTIIPQHRLLISTSSDRTIRLWDLTPLNSKLAPTTTQIIRAHTRPVDCLAWRLEGSNIVVWSADSMGVIKQWTLEDGSLHHLKDLSGHETSVAQLAVDEEGLWSASMDKTVIYHPFAGISEIVIEPASYVKSLMLLDDQQGRTILLTGTNDDDILVWNVSSRSGGRGLLKAVVCGHTGAVTALRRWAGASQYMVISASLDGTLRRWTLSELLEPTPVTTREPETSTLTGDEERELAELLAEDEA